MRHYGTPGKKGFVWFIASVALVAFLEGLFWAVKSPFLWKELVWRWIFVATLLAAARWVQPYSDGRAYCIWPWPAVLIFGIGLAAMLIYVGRESSWAAWIVLTALYLLLSELSTALTNGRGVIWRWGVHGALALAGGVIPVAIVQIESHFADEEFFVALQALALSIFWLLLLGAQRLLTRSKPTPAQRGIRLNNYWIALALLLFALVGSGVTVWAYQHSFYPPDAPGYEGISAETPFICGKVQPDSQIFDGDRVFYRLLARVKANPHKGPPEYGMLALGSGEHHWAETFRESFLNEANEGRYTGPAHSVKSVQYEAALRIYYYARVRTAFPELFTPEEEREVRNWFAAINRRALTVEWVDWMYALAFTKWPEGPYENQENGAGLLALLEAEGLAAPDLSPANRDYLERNQRGWNARFRNTDDALVYQPEWINNAYFQSLYTDKSPGDNLRLSFEWLLDQALPDGAPLTYNHPAHPSLAGIAYLGAELVQDPRYVWMAGRALATAEAQGKYLPAQPGVESPVSLTGRSPTMGSCLLYGDSGLPNQVGPLAPDKIVFRDAWSDDSAYLLLNLRFTGWHRYKATNTIALIYQNGSLVADELDGASFAWLPVGRSAFRDKRVPRENLSGLLVERTGMSAVLYTLTGVGGPWAQDPPYYAEVVDFETGDEMDWSHTRLTNWRGWQHDRWVYFYHNGGPIVVVDEAEGTSGSKAALSWHLAKEGNVEGRRIWLRGGENPVEVLFIPTNSERKLEIGGNDSGNSDMSMVYYPSSDKIRLVTLFLLGRWAGSEVEVTEEKALRITQSQEHLIFPLPKD